MWVFYGKRLFETIQIKIGCRLDRKFMTEEHIAVITEPSHNFLTHITPESSTPKINSYSVVDFYYYKDNMYLDKLLGIGHCLGQIYNLSAMTNNLRTFHALEVQF